MNAVRNVYYVLLYAIVTSTSSVDCRGGLTHLVRGAYLGRTRRWGQRVVSATARFQADPNDASRTKYNTTLDRTTNNLLIKKTYSFHKIIILSFLLNNISMSD